MNRTDRLMGILLEFQARGQVRAEDLAQRFEVSVRTIYRDVEALCETGVPIAAMPGKGYRLMEGYFLPPLSLTADEASMLALGGRFIRERVDGGLRKAADDALTKLAGVLPPERRAEVERRQRELLFPSSRANPHEQKLAVLRRAIEDRRVVRMVYQAYRRPESERREVEPISLVFMAEAWHVAAYCRMRQGPRIFRLDRIDALEPLAANFTIGERHTGIGPPPADRRAEFAEARVRFSPDVVRWVRERQPWLFLREEMDIEGPVFVYALRDEEAMASWLLGWGRSVQVIEPPSLRQRLASEARAVLEQHAEDPSQLPATTVSGASR